jgi:hypothetical protein
VGDQARRERDVHRHADFTEITQMTLLTEITHKKFPDLLKLGLKRGNANLDLTRAEDKIPSGFILRLRFFAALR